MKLAASIARSLHEDMQVELRGMERAVATGTRDAGRGLKTELRRQVASAGLGQRLANSWRDRHYPNQQLDAASLVYTKAPQIILAFDDGAVIRSECGRLLAIPTGNASEERNRRQADPPEHLSGAPFRTAPVRASLEWPLAPGRGWIARLVQGAQRLPACQRSGAAQRPGSDHCRHPRDPFGLALL